MFATAVSLDEPPVPTSVGSAPRATDSQVTATGSELACTFSGGSVLLEEATYAVKFFEAGDG